MMRGMAHRAAFAFILLLFVVTGCGAASRSYTLSASRSCLSAVGKVQPKNALDTAYSVSGGAIEIDIGSNTATVMFHRTVGDAKRTYESALLVGDALGGASDVTSRQGTVVMSWQNTPTDVQRHDVADCLT